MLGGRFHRTDGPARIREDGTREWWIEGKRHRADGPAIEYANGDREWWRNGVLTRKQLANGMSEIYEEGKLTRREWRVCGQLHRDGDLPAIEHVSGDLEWYRDGELHRAADKPAIVRANGTREWWQCGVRHRMDGPAITRANGSYEWWRGGVEHRADGPAMMLIDTVAHKTEETWMQNGRKHRADGGPAVTKNSASFSFAAPQGSRESRAIIPDVVTREWWFEGTQHRADGPAIIFTQTWADRAWSHCEWWRGGARHRADGPAIVCDCTRNMPHDFCRLCDKFQRDEKRKLLAIADADDPGDTECATIVEYRWWYQGHRFDSREEYLRANPWWSMTAHLLALGRADPKCMLSFLSQDIVRSIALACFARD